NEAGTIVEVILRRATEADKALTKKINAVFTEREEEAILTVDVDCSKVQERLEEVYRKDQEIRKGNTMPDPDIDRENQQMVVSIIEKCGFPSAEIHGNTSVQAAFLVI